MGVKFCKGTVYETYAPYITPTDSIELKENWPLIKIFKLKKLFQTKSLHSQSSQQRYLDYQTFIEIFSQLNEEKLHSYTEKQRKRLFNLFDKQGEGKLVWSDFFSGLTLCYYGCPQILAALLFALYDQKLKLVLSKDYIQNLLQNNSRYLKEKGEDINQVGLQIGFVEMNISQWIQQSTEWINYDKFRQVFGIFVQEQMEKELGQNFNELNDLYVNSKQKYVGYLVNRKWFESWRIFLLKEYGIELIGYGKFQTYARTNKTIKTLRTKKSIRSLKSSKTIKTVNSGASKKKLTDAPRLKKFILPPQLKSNATHYNLIHANIGDRPKQIRNNTLQGQFNQILAPGLVENVDYVIVSEQIWGKLKLIYGAYPEFRRSGESEIEIYPKNVKLYTRVCEGIIDFEDQKLCQFSSKMQLKQLIGKASQLEVEQLDDFCIFIKSFSMNQWEIVQDLTIKVADISPEFLIFMALVPRQDFMLFSQRYCHHTTDINHLHVGDECLYFQVGGTIGKRALIVSQTRRKVVLHLKGTSYINDLCLERQIFLKRIGLIKKQNLKKVRMEQHQLNGISDGRGLDFINSVILVLLNNQQLVKCLQQLFQGVSRPTNIGQYLAIIYKMLSGNDSPKTIVIADFVRIYFTNFLHFQLWMAQEFLHQIVEKLHKCFSAYNKKIIQQYRIKTQSHGICVYCSCINSTQTNYFLLCVPISEEELLYYQVIFVPYSYTVSYSEHLRIAFTLPHGSTFKQYKQAFQKAAEIKGAAYVLVEVQGHDIIKNYHNAFSQATLQQLMLREQDTIYAYELCVKMESFISDHYTTDPVIKPRSLKQGQLIDFVKKSPLSIAQLTNRKLKSEEQEERIWNFGKIVSIDNEKYTHKLSINIQYRQKRGEILQIQINPESQAVAPFPTKSFKFSQNYHLRCIQRVYNEASNQMELVNIPFVIMVSNWMRMKEIQLLVYQQIKDLIDLKGRFRIEQSQSSRMGKKQRIKKFREYLSKNKPYSLRFTDLEGRCAFCYKLQKQKFLQSEAEFVCDGNQQINPQQPVFWTLKPYQIKICVDWKSPFQFYQPKSSDHSSVTDVYASRKESMQTLYSCIEDRFNCTYPAQCTECHEDEGVQSWQQSIVNSPEHLVILLDRVNEETKNFSKRPIHFETQEMVLGNIVYQLRSAIAINTNKKSVHPYLVYIRDKTRWLQYQGEVIRVVKKTATIQRICALTLFYNKIGFRQKVDIK